MSNKGLGGFLMHFGGKFRFSCFDLEIILKRRERHDNGMLRKSGLLQQLMEHSVSKMLRQYAFMEIQQTLSGNILRKN